MTFCFDTTHVAITHATEDALLGEVSARLAQGQGFALATLNLDHLVKLKRDPRFRLAYQRQDLVVADGNPIVWLLRLSGRKVDLLPGSDLILPLARTAAAMGRPLSILGASEEAIQGAAQVLRDAVPELQIGLLIAPPMGFDPEDPAAQDALAQLAAQGPGLCLIALGAPKQERLAALGRQLAPQIGFASVGAGVEFLSGHQTRAPGWVRALALEWMWRALSSPRRLMPRYAACLAILPEQVLSALRARRKARIQGASFVFDQPAPTTKTPVRPVGHDA